MQRWDYDGITLTRDDWGNYHVAGLRHLPEDIGVHIHLTHHPDRDPEVTITTFPAPRMAIPEYLAATPILTGFTAVTSTLLDRGIIISTDRLDGPGPRSVEYPIS